MDGTVTPLISQLDLHALLGSASARDVVDVRSCTPYRVHAYQWTLAPMREPASTLQVGVALIDF